jgi:hypothetical protein
MSLVYDTGATSKPSIVWKRWAGIVEPHSSSAAVPAHAHSRALTSSTSPTRRNMSSASACPGTMLASVPPRMTPTL